MFDEQSRYHDLETAHWTAPDGRRVPYKRRRFPPPAIDDTLAEVTVGQDQRLDQIAAEHLGDPESFWRICDANHALNPFELTDRPGRRLRIPLPSLAQG